MLEALLAIEGTPTAGRVALILALIAALAHAIFSAIQKGKTYDPFTSRAAIDGFFFIYALPIVLFIVPFPQGHEWLLIAGIVPVHLLYKFTLLGAYRNGDFSVVYPVVRGSAPLFTAVFAMLLFGEILRPGQWLGILILSLSISLLAWSNAKAADQDLDKLKIAMLFAIATGLTITIYTIYDAYGIRNTANPFTFLAWFYLVDGISFPTYKLLKWKKKPNRQIDWKLLKIGAVAAVFGYISFGSVMIALRLDQVGSAAAIRETSVVFAAIIGWLFLGERIGAVRALLIVFIGVGAALVELG